MSSDEHILSIASNRGMIVAYDPELLRERVKAPSSWWKEAPLATAERQDGRLALWPLSAGKAVSRAYRVRIGAALRESEQPYERGHSEPAPLQVVGEELFVGPVERLPGDGSGDRLPALPDAGQLIPAQPGRYRVTVHVLDWQSEDRFWNEDNEPTPDAPPDLVLRLEAGEDELPAPPPTPRPLLELIPKKTPQASKKVRFARRPRPVEPTPTKRRRGASGSRSRKKKKVIQVKELAPGELGIGASVRHPVYGIGTVLFVRDGFPKAKVSFQNQEYKVDKDELTVM